nr:hypothetical protein [Actinotalea sp. C106]
MDEASALSGKATTEAISPTSPMRGIACVANMAWCTPAAIGVRVPRGWIELTLMP